jgi:hypothetical protein
MVEPDVQVLMFVQYDIGLYTGLLSSFLLDLRYFNFRIRGVQIRSDDLV